jgi:hypothetical protein
VPAKRPVKARPLYLPREDVQRVAAVERVLEPVEDATLVVWSCGTEHGLSPLGTAQESARFLIKGYKTLQYLSSVFSHFHAILLAISTF